MGAAESKLYAEENKELGVNCQSYAFGRLIHLVRRRQRQTGLKDW